MYKHILSPKLPNECPTEPTPQNCGLVAANYLLEMNLITWDDMDVAHIDPFGDDTLQVLDRKQEWRIGEVPARVDFGCLACGKCVRIQDEPFGTESVDIVQD